MQESGVNEGGKLVKVAGVKTFDAYLKQRSAALGKVAASHMNPERLFKIVLNCVLRTPKLQDCSMESIFRSTLQAAELGLEPGSALGEAYLVPYGNQCTFLPGYRGLVALAYRSGEVACVRARAVFEGDEFSYSDGLDMVLAHTPKGETDAAKITHVWCVIELKSGAKIPDVMTRGEVDRIRGRSKAGNSGPWVTDYAEMAKKTVLRRALKLAPMSIEMSKALAADVAVDTGDTTMLEFEGDLIIDNETGEVVEEKRKTGTDAVKAKLGVQEQAQEACHQPDINVCEKCNSKTSAAQRIASQQDHGMTLCSECMGKQKVGE